ncbi:hypothetical protein BC938DRAFT_471943 [Jimgerdemannia flammicorona]|uniref:Uncharacterized protein n=1 Tax=Jimgerdemannia flammicorona TaxID=994334 RepID=A0A433Q717_9FUNG|nr:hypothetical protein BC938DRAFT_471943 [Jimgerdemannia flammicorona]
MARKNVLANNKFYQKELLLLPFESFRLVAAKRTNPDTVLHELQVRKKSARRYVFCAHKHPSREHTDEQKQSSLPSRPEPEQHCSTDLTILTLSKPKTPSQTLTLITAPTNRGWVGGWWCNGRTQWRQMLGGRHPRLKVSHEGPFGASGSVGLWGPRWWGSELRGRRR